MKHRLICSLLATYAVSLPIFSQEALKSTEEEYYDFLSLQGLAERPTLGYRTLSDSEWTLTEEAKTADENVWKNNSLGSKWTVYEPAQKTDNFFTRGIDQSIKVKIYGPEWFNSYNTAAPYGQNDGALWQGKGYNTSFTAGARLEAYGLEATFKPQLSFSQNREFDIMPSVTESPYGYFQSGIDAPQRFGDKSFWTYDWGDSEVRYTWHNLTFGAGFQNPWLGPAWLNPMLGSNNATSYPKVDAGLRKTPIYMPYFGWNIGDIEGRIWLGRLTESEYFDSNPDNNSRLLTAMSASFSPSFIPNLTLGFNRIFLTNFSKHNLKYIGRLFTLSESNGSQTGTGEDEDQKVSLFIDWAFPKIGFEAWGELGIDDFSVEKLSNPFHTAIYSVGLKQITPFPVDWLKGEIITEWNNFEMSQDFQLQWTYTGYYSHSQIKQGYTNQGQILGAGTGSFGNSQFLGYKVYHPYGNIMLFYHRHSPDNNYIYNKSIGTSDAYGTDLYYTYWAKFKTYRSYGISATQYLGDDFFINAKITRLFLEHAEYDSIITSGFSFALTAKYIF